MKPKFSRKKEIKMTAELNEIDNKKTIENNEAKNQLFEKINKTDKPVAILRKKEKRLQKIKSEVKEKLHRQKYKGLYKIIMEGYMPPNSLTQKTWTILKKI